MKKSVEAAMGSALEKSHRFPNLLVRVMNQQGQRAVVVTSDRDYKERVLDGWQIVVAFQNGKRIKRF